LFRSLSAPSPTVKRESKIRTFPGAFHYFLFLINPSIYRGAYVTPKEPTVLTFFSLGVSAQAGYNEYSAQIANQAYQSDINGKVP
jgi:hypothetical protein